MKITQYFITSFFVLSSLACSYAQVKLGNNLNAIDSSALLELESTNKGFLPPRLSNSQRNAINNPSPGLTIYNTSTNCVQSWTGDYWFDYCFGIQPVVGSQITLSNGTDPFSANSACRTATISRTPCSAVNGARLNDDTSTLIGVEYNWPSGINWIDGDSVRNLVEVSGQCWYQRNAVNIPTNYNPSPSWSNNTNNGWHGFYSGGPYTNEGRLYQWSAAMNGSTNERAQGVCPSGWHIPSDCELQYFEHSINMSITHQNTIGSALDRQSGFFGAKTTTWAAGANSTNSTGLTFLPTGARQATNGSFSNRGSGGVGSVAFIWTSTPSGGNAFRRIVPFGENGAGRTAVHRANAYSVRCIKD